jgi:hypothetical protein
MYASARTFHVIRHHRIGPGVPRRASPPDGDSELIEDEAAGIRRALASLHAGKGRTLAQVRQTLDAIAR